tara:strand:- start:1162 stop:1518 length:357 start_codon:yes stop_codon:yes gene_type:complete
MAFIPNKQEANSPQANSSTITHAVTVAAAHLGPAPPAGPNYQLLFSSTSGLSPVISDGYYLLIQNNGTVNLEIVFNDDVDGVIIYPSATLEFAVSQGTNVWVKNSLAAAGALRVIAFA